MTRYSSTMSEAYKKVMYRNSVLERDLTDAEEKRREEIAKDLPDQEFKDRYGARWKDVKMATATKMAKKESLEEAVRWKVKIEGLPPIYMDAGSASEVRTKLRKLVKQPDMIQDIDRVTDTQMKKDLRNRLAGKEPDPSAEVNEEMNPTDHVKKKGDKYCVYNADGSIAKEFDNKEDADKYAIANHDKLMAKEALDEKLKFTHAVLEPDGNILGFSSNERDAKDMARNNLRNVKGKVVTLKKPMAQRKGDMMIGRPLKEDGHTDVSSAIRQCKTVLEDAMQIMGKLKSMSGEDSLPTWWTNKLAVASNSMNKIRDYILVPSMQEQIELDERMKLPRQLIDTNKEVMIVKKNKVIVIDKKDKDKYMRQGWELAEKLDKEDEPKVKEIVKKLKKASDAHAGQAKDLEKAVNETVVTSKELLDNKYKEEKNGAQHFSKVNEDNYVWNFVYDDFGRTKLTTEPDKATHLVYTMEGKDNPQLLKISEREILDYKKGENNGLSKK